MRKLAVAFLVLVANSAYLAARADPSLFYFANVALHLGLGVLVAVAAARELPLWRRWPRTLTLAAPLLALAAVAGTLLAIVGNTRGHTWLLQAHVGAAAAGSVLVLAWMAATVVRRARPGETAAPAIGLAVL